MHGADLTNGEAFLRADSKVDDVNVRAMADDLRIADGPFDGNWHKERLDSLPCHPLSGSATECRGLEDLPFARTIGNASHHGAGLRDRGGDKPQGQASAEEGTAVEVEMTIPTQITLRAPTRVRCRGRIHRCELKAGDTAGMAMAIEKYEFLPGTEDAA